MSKQQDETLDTYNLVMSANSEYRQRLNAAFENSSGDATWKLLNFTKYVPRQSLAKFLCRSEMFNRVRKIQGSVVECGVFSGFGLFAWHQLSSIYEPLNYQRKIIGFDTFDGFPSLAEEDHHGSDADYQVGDMACQSYEELDELRAIQAENMLVSFPEKIVLCKGDASSTIPAYVEEHPETIVSLLYLDFDLYEPTKVALETFLPRMPKGAVIAFDEVNVESFPGETVALLETLGVRELTLERFEYDTKICFAVI